MDSKKNVDKLAITKARIDLLESQVDRLQERVIELEKIIEDFNTEQIIDRDDFGDEIESNPEIIGRIMRAEIPAGDSLPTSHVSLIIDLNK